MLFKKICEIIIEMMDLAPDYDLEKTTSLKDDVQADSVDAIEIIMALENEFEIEIPDEDAASFETLGDLEAYIEKKLENL